MTTTNLIRDFKADLDFFFSERLNRPLAKPYWVFFSLTHRCTYDCQMCGVKSILTEHDLDIALIKRSLDEVAGWGTDCTVLFTGGEAFLRKDIFEIIGYSVSLGLTTEVVSNGSLIDEKIAGRIMASGLSNIAISLDGATAATHDHIRGVKGAFEKSLGALKLLSREKAAHSHKQGPQISAWTTMMRENVHELYDIIQVARNAGVECLVYHPVIVSQADMQNTIAGGHLWITPELLGAFKVEIDKLVEYRRLHGLVAELHDPYQWIGYFQGSLSRKDWTCNPFVFIDIGPDGNVRSCGPSFGSIKDMSLTECLHTAAADQARERMRVCQKPCLQTCWARPGTDSLGVIVNNFTARLDRAGLPAEEKTVLLAESLKLVEHYETLVTGDGKDGR